jgi:hypothetical protein
MEIHKPKAAHSAREFLIEIGTIICGILIALGLEQLLEHLRWEGLVAQTREQLRAEAGLNVTDGLKWLSVSPCLDEELTQLRDHVWEARRTGSFVPPPRAYEPSLQGFQTDAWLNARSAQVTDHLPAQELRDYSSFYFWPVDIASTEVSLHQVAAELEPLDRALDRVTPAEADEFISRIGQAREYQSRVIYGAIMMARSGQRLKAPVDLHDHLQLLELSRALRGDCVLDAAKVNDALQSARSVTAAYDKLGIDNTSRLSAAYFSSNSPRPGGSHPK